MSRVCETNPQLHSSSRHATALLLNALSSMNSVPQLPHHEYLNIRSSSMHALKTLHLLGCLAAVATCTSLKPQITSKTAICTLNLTKSTILRTNYSKVTKKNSLLPVPSIRRSILAALTCARSRSSTGFSYS